MELETGIAIGSGVIHRGHVLTVLESLPDHSIDCCVTSPPYYGLRDYKLPPSKWHDGWKGCLGLEDTPDRYIRHLVDVMSEVWRVMRPWGTLWVVIGDSYATKPHGTSPTSDPKSRARDRTEGDGAGRQIAGTGHYKHKDLLGIPWSLAFALRKDGWYLRSDIIWHKPNAMPGSQTDRPTNAHEYVFMLSKQEKYYYDHEAVKTPATDVSIARRERADLRMKDGYADAHFGNPPIRTRKSDKQRGHSRRHDGFNDCWDQMTKEEQQSMATLRDVWTVGTKGYKGAHFAVYPETLIQPCIKAGCPIGSMVLDPFMGAGTTGLAAAKLGRNFVGVELSTKYCMLAGDRLTDAGIEVEIL